MIAINAINAAPAYSDPRVDGSTPSVANTGQIHDVTDAYGMRNATVSPHAPAR
ncbi:hypothetical protein LMG29660_01471 [Burkholderia puraquae]|uniref:Uncharacterized protein n=1 Tax=Burkholderia puraquae TaxID=1904757 RepID=A0A6J5DDT9_9BURK|nr:hypothetical protein [Burkholderia puraquae]CAB3751145.1 hypothetical protein LMG29660_01471 [Burkholderia puraquae]